MKGLFIPLTEDCTWEYTVGWALTGLGLQVQTAPAAERTGPAHLFTQVHEQGMVFVKKPGIGREVCHKKLLVSGVAFTIVSQPRTTQKAACVGINNENRLIAGIKYYGVGGFLADAVDTEEMLPQPADILSK